MNCRTTPRHFLLHIIVVSFLAITVTACSNVFHDMNNQRTVFSGPSAIAPSVEYTYPTSDPNGAHQVVLNKVILLSFNKDMNLDSVPVNAVLLTDVTTGAPLSGTIQTYNNRIIIFDPTDPLPGQDFTAGHTYRATLNRDLTDSDGIVLPAGYTWTFITGSALDTTGPAIISTYPANDQIAGTTTDIRCVFNEEIKPSTINTVNFTVTRLVHGGPSQPVSGAVTSRFIQQPDGTYRHVGIFTPSTPLALNAEYVATASAAITDIAGNNLQTTYTWHFSTGAVICELEPASNYRLAAGTFGAPGTAYGYLLSDAAGNLLPTWNIVAYVDQGISGPMATGKALRIVANGVAVNSPTGMNLTPVFKRLIYGQMVSPPRNQCYVDPVNGIFILPRPIYWSTMESTTGITTPEIRHPDYSPVIEANTGITYPAVKFGNGYLQGTATAWTLYTGSIYPLGKDSGVTLDKGSLSLWANVYASNEGFNKYTNLYVYINKETNTFVNVYCDKVNSTISFYHNGALEASQSVPRNATNHLYVVWDRDKGLSGGTSLRVFVNGVEVLSSTTVIFGSNTHLTATTWSDWGAWSYVYLDNLKIWNHIASEDPSFEYNGGAGNENGLHAIYGPTNNYCPDLTNPGNGVGYYYVPME